MPRGKKWLRKSEQGDKWNRCLIEPTFPRSAAWVRRNPVRVLPI